MYTVKGIIGLQSLLNKYGPSSTMEAYGNIGHVDDFNDV